MTKEQAAVLNPRFIMVKDQMIQALRDQAKISAKRDTELYKYRTMLSVERTNWGKYILALSGKAEETQSPFYNNWIGYAQAWDRVALKNPQGGLWDITLYDPGRVSYGSSFTETAGYPDYELILSNDYLKDTYEGYPRTEWQKNVASDYRGYKKYPRPAGNPYWNNWFGVQNDNLLVLLKKFLKDYPDWSVLDEVGISNSVYYSDPKSQTMTHNENGSLIHITGTPEFKEAATFAQNKFYEFIKPSMDRILGEQEVIYGLTADLYNNAVVIHDLQEEVKALAKELNLSYEDLMKLIEDDAKKEDVAVPKKPFNPLLLIAAGAALLAMTGSGNE